MVSFISKLKNLYLDPKNLKLEVIAISNNS